MGNMLDCECMPRPSVNELLRPRHLSISTTRMMEGGGLFSRVVWHQEHDRNTAGLVSRVDA